MNRRYGFSERKHDADRTLLIKFLWKFQDAYEDEAHNNSNRDRRIDMMERYHKMSNIIREVMEVTDLSEKFDEKLLKAVYEDEDAD